jgi:mannose-6-phosphate isomerase-like protein (cupin superfamily)
VLSAGTRLENPVTGERLVIRVGAEESSGEYLHADYWLKPGGGVAAAHIHPLQEETFAVLSGTPLFVIGRTRQLAQTGERCVVPAGTPHRILNPSDREVHLLTELRPALRSAELLQTIWGLALDGKTDAKGFPNFVQIAVTAQEFRSEIHFAGAPHLVQRLVFGALAPLGRMLGYRGAYVPGGMAANTTERCMDGQTRRLPKGSGTTWTIPR